MQLLPGNGGVRVSSRAKGSRLRPVEPCPSTKNLYSSPSWTPGMNADQYDPVFDSGWSVQPLKLPRTLTRREVGSHTRKVAPDSTRFAPIGALAASAMSPAYSRENDGRLTPADTPQNFLRRPNVTNNSSWS